MATNSLQFLASIEHDKRDCWGFLVLNFQINHIRMFEWVIRFRLFCDVTTTVRWNCLYMFMFRLHGWSLEMKTVGRLCTLSCYTAPLGGHSDCFTFVLALWTSWCKPTSAYFCSQGRIQLQVGVPYMGELNCPRLFDPGKPVSDPKSQQIRPTAERQLRLAFWHNNE